jgi:hypothetical protein
VKRLTTEALALFRLDLLSGGNRGRRCRKPSKQKNLVCLVPAGYSAATASIKQPEKIGCFIEAA